MSFLPRSIACIILYNNFKFIFMHFYAVHVNNNNNNTNNNIIVIPVGHFVEVCYYALFFGLQGRKLAPALAGDKSPS